jgi:hypothetical protein
MTQNQVQQEIAIIKEMIEKTRRDTAESGLLFIVPGILCILMILLMASLNWFNATHLAKPVMFISMAVITLTSIYIGYRESKKAKVETYVKKIFGALWIAIGASCCIFALFFPLMEVYSWNMVGVTSFVVLGIGFFVTGALHELPLIQWCSLFWWIGASALPFAKGYSSMFLIIAIFLFGYILPGLIMNRHYKTRSRENEA